MLFGEHAVLHGRYAMVMAMGQRLHITLSPRADRQVHIASELGVYRGALEALPPSREFRFLLAAIEAARGELPSGFDLRVQSEFSSTIGFGSSAAVTVAAVAALCQWASDSAERRRVFERARNVVRAVQGVGSGADVAASTYGGFLLYRADPVDIQPVDTQHPLTAIYSGSKTPTPEVIAIVEARRAQDPDAFERIFDMMGACAQAAAAAARQSDWDGFGQLMNQAQELMASIGICNDALAAIIARLRADPGIRGAKISGSGLGDCAIGLGRPTGSFPWDFIPVDADATGVVVEVAT